jgi:hypothetical protein
LLLSDFDVEGQLRPNIRNEDGKSTIIPLVAMDEMTPPFCGPKDWVELTCQSIIKGFDQSDSTSSRVAPIGLVRFARGGKSRALHEIEQYFRNHHKDITVIFVSFNDVSSLVAEERADPVEALCRRICFWFLKDRTNSNDFGAQFDEILQCKVDCKAVLQYLGNGPCILLIDELNQFVKAETRALAEFLKTNFLVRKGRFFVFSSHVLTTKQILREFMDGDSDREVEILKLPTIPSLGEAREKLVSDLTPQQAIYCGLAPALIHTWYNLGELVEYKGDPVTLSYDEVRWLCSTFVDGDVGNVPAQFLRYMEADSKANVLCIPYHIVQIMVLMNQQSRKTCHWRVLAYCRNIANAFKAFETAELKI